MWQSACEVVADGRLLHGMEVLVGTEVLVGMEVLYGIDGEGCLE